jgi:hypothetical protein
MNFLVHLPGHFEKKKTPECVLSHKEILRESDQQQNLHVHPEINTSVIFLKIPYFHCVKFPAISNIMMLSWWKSHKKHDVVMMQNFTQVMLTVLYDTDFC